MRYGVRLLASESTCPQSHSGVGNCRLPRIEVQLSTLSISHSLNLLLCRLGWCQSTHEKRRSVLKPSLLSKPLCPQIKALFITNL